MTRIPTGPQEPGRKIIQGIGADAALIMSVGMTMIGRALGDRDASEDATMEMVRTIYGEAQEKVAAVVAGRTYDLGEWGPHAGPDFDQHEEDDLT